jgi:3-dehydroquinate synthase
MNPQKVVISRNLTQALTTAVAECEHDRTFILVDETTERCCLPLVSGMDCVEGAQTIVIGATDTHKTLDSLAHVWEELGKGGGTRHSLLINIGGGMVTDLGGFAASTFKRGINYINIPTTLLAMVDASVGGKTGINFRGLKNEIGVFSNASTVILDTTFLKTLDAENICSGYAEMLKHGLISNEKMWAELMNFDLAQPNLQQLRTMVADSVAVKQRIVTEDPLEQGIRKALNLGHTVGHAFESLAIHRGHPVPHGYAVAWGLVTEAVLSHMLLKFPSEDVHRLGNFVRDNYRGFPFTCDDYDDLLALMRHDKKSRDGEITCTLLSAIADYRIDQTLLPDDVTAALDILRDHLGM